MEPVETPLDRANAVNMFWSAHDDALFTQPVVAAVADFSEAYFERGRWGGFGPRFLKIGRRVRYRKKDVIDWLENRQTVLSATEEAEKNPEQPRGNGKRKARAKPKAKGTRRVASKGTQPQQGGA